MRDVILTVIMIVLVPASLLSPYIGVLGWTWVSYFNPTQFAWGFSQSLPVAYMVAIPTLIGILFTRKRQWLPVTSETILLLLLWFWFAVTTVHVAVSPIFVHHLQASMNRLTLVSKILLMAFVCVIVVTDRNRLTLWYRTTGGIFAFFAFKAAIFGVLTHGQFRVLGPPNSMLADNNDFALAMNMALPMFAYLASIEQGRKLRLLWRISLLCGIVASILTYSRGGFLGLAATLVVLAWRSKYRVRAIVALALLGAAMALVLPSQWSDRMDTIGTAADTDASAQGRIEAWRVATSIALDSPLTGGGFETFTQPVYAMYGQFGDQLHVAHSIYFQMVGEHGFAGLAIFLLLMASVFRSCGKLRTEFRDDPQANWISATAQMVQVSGIAYAVSGIFLSRAYFDLYYQIVVTVIILKVFARAERAAKPEDSVASCATEDSAVPCKT